MPKPSPTRPATLTDADEFRVLAEWDWVYTASRPGRLHHFAELVNEPDMTDEWCSAAFSANGKTMCGLTGRFFIPGIFSRMGMLRCARCCDRLGWPRGIGSPKNDEALRPLVVARLEVRND